MNIQFLFKSFQNEYVTLNRYYSIVFEKLSQIKNKDISVVVMYDFFIDRIITLKTKEEFCNSLDEKIKFGGGSIRNIPTRDIKGGNAVNVAYHLAHLGLKVDLFTIADEFGKSLLQKTFSKFGNRVRLYISNGKPGLTTSLEFQDEKNDTKVNVMLSSLGDNVDFAPQRIIDFKDGEKVLSDANVVVMVNWATNLKSKELAQYVFDNSPAALHFIDPADIETRKDEFYDFIKHYSKDIDVLSINENECNSLYNSMSLNFTAAEEKEKDSENGEELFKKAAKTISNKTEITSVDLHTRLGAAWSNGNDSVFNPSIKTEIKMMTGAGDSWDAADIFGYVAGLPPKDRLYFANLYTSLFIGSSDLEPATLEQLHSVCK